MILCGINILFIVPAPSGAWRTSAVRRATSSCVKKSIKFFEISDKKHDV
jgi:hypothetical protein